MAKRTAAAMKPRIPLQVTIPLKKRRIRNIKSHRNQKTNQSPSATRMVMRKRRSLRNQRRGPKVPKRMTTHLAVTKIMKMMALVVRYCDADYI